MQSFYQKDYQIRINNNNSLKKNATNDKIGQKVDVKWN